MTARDYRNNRAAYVEGDTTLMVKCITCEGMFPEDEAVLFKDQYQCEDCAEHSGLRRCAWCGEVDMITNFVMQDDGPWHQRCLDEVDEAHRKFLDQAAERFRDEVMREDAEEERREVARTKTDEAREK